MQCQECLEGGSVHDVLARASCTRLPKVACKQFKRLYSYADALRWTMQAAHALHHIHTATPQVRHEQYPHACIFRLLHAGAVALLALGA